MSLSTAEVLFAQHDPGTRFFIVLSGSLSEYSAVAGDGAEQPQLGENPSPSARRPARGKRKKRKSEFDSWITADRNALLTQLTRVHREMLLEKKREEQEQPPTPSWREHASCCRARACTKSTKMRSI